MLQHNCNDLRLQISIIDILGIIAGFFGVFADCSNRE
jgi:hypothetical protein